MPISRRSMLAAGVLAALAVLLFGAHWYESSRARPKAAVAAMNTVVHVTNGGDRGPGSLREALFLVAGAASPSRISLEVPIIVLETALPALVNGLGVTMTAQPAGTEIDAHALGGGPVLDISGPNTSFEGITIRNCPAAAILVRTVRFHLSAATVEGCDVGVDVAENASSILLERNRFVANRVGVRFAAAGRDSAVANNEFRDNREAGLWAVRGATESHEDSVDVHDNKFIENGIGVVAGNLAVRIERNEFMKAHEAGAQIVGAGVVFRANRLDGGAAMGIVVENARGALIEDNEIDGMAAYGIMVRNSANSVVQRNRVHNCGYGLAFVLGDPRSQSSAIDNAIIEPKFNGIDVIGDSPVLRRNQVLRAHAYALHVEDVESANRSTVKAQPFLAENNFGGSPVDHTAKAVKAAK